jgi:hypothetical protein
LSQAGPEPVENAKSDAQGKFHFQQTPGPGPALIEADWDGVTYNLLVPPGTSTTALEVDVFNASKNPAIVNIPQHMLVLEPSGAELTVNDSYLLANGGNVTYNDPASGTLRFFVPEAASGTVKVSAQEPRGLPIERDAEKTKTAGVYKVSFPIKPGETQITVHYTLPLGDPAMFSARNLTPGTPLRLVVPNGVTLKGDGLKALGQEPKSQAVIYEVAAPKFQVEIQGAGSLRATASENEPGEAGDDGPAMQTMLPRVLDRMAVVLVAVFLALGLGFVLLYRRGPRPAEALSDAKPGSKRRG